MVSVNKVSLTAVNYPKNNKQLHFKGTQDSFRKAEEDSYYVSYPHSFITDIKGKHAAGNAQKIQAANSIDIESEKKIFDDTMQKFRDTFLALLDTQATEGKKRFSAEDKDYSYGTSYEYAKQYYDENGNMCKQLRLGRTERNTDIAEIEEVQENSEGTVSRKNWYNTKRNMMTKEKDGITYAEGVTDKKTTISYGKTKIQGNLRKADKITVFDKNGNVTEIKKGCSVFQTDKNTILRADEVLYYDGGKLIQADKNTETVCGKSYSADERFVYSNRPQDNSILRSYDRGYHLEKDEKRKSWKQHIEFGKDNKVLYSSKL